MALVEPAWSRLAEFIVPLEYLFMRRSCSQMREASQPWLEGMIFARTRPHRFAHDHTGTALQRTEAFLSIAFWKDTYRQCMELGAGYGWMESVWQESYNVVHHDWTLTLNSVRVHYNEVPDEIYSFMNLCLRAHAQSTEAPAAGQATMRNDCVACLTLTADPTALHVHNSLHGLMVLDDGDYAIIGAFRYPDFDHELYEDATYFANVARGENLSVVVQEALRITALGRHGMRPVFEPRQSWLWMCFGLQDLRQEACEVLVSAPEDARLTNCVQLRVPVHVDNSLHGLMVLDDGAYAIIGALRCPDFDDEPDEVAIISRTLCEGRNVARGENPSFVVQEALRINALRRDGMRPIFEPRQSWLQMCFADQELRPEACEVFVSAPEDARLANCVQWRVPVLTAGTDSEESGREY